MTKTKRLLLSIIVILLIAVGVVYATYAFFQATVDSTGDNVGGQSSSGAFSVTPTVVHKATKLIPVSEATVNATVNKASNNCVDNNNKDTCTLYKVTVANGVDPITINSFVRTNSSTYTTNHLKYKVFTKSGNTYTAVSDAMVISHNAGDSVYAKLNNTNITFSLLANATQDLYFAFWIEEVNQAQNDDQNKDYSCKIGFEANSSTQLSVSFSV